MKHEPLSRILVPTDMSDASAHALRYATRLASRFDATLLVVYARDVMPPIDFGAPMTPMTLNADLEEIAREELLAFAESNIVPQVPFEIAVADDTPLNAILSYAKTSRAQLIVMGTHGRTGFRRLVLGSVTETVMRHATVPVLTIGTRTADTRISPAMPRIACYIDDVRSAQAVLEAAAAVAGPTTEFTILTTGSTMTRAAIPAELARRTHITPLEEEDVVTEVTLNARSILADLIVLATPLRHDPLDVLRGTAVERIVQQSACPVLVVNEAQRPVAAKSTLVPSEAATY